jgi:hypothetical protein
MPSPRPCPRARHDGRCSAIATDASSKSSGGSRPHQGDAQAQRELQGRHPEAGMRLPPKMTPAQIAEAQRMARVEAPRCAREEPL